MVAIAAEADLGRGLNNIEEASITATIRLGRIFRLLNQRLAYPETYPIVTAGMGSDIITPILLQDIARYNPRQGPIAITMVQQQDFLPPEHSLGTILELASPRSTATQRIAAVMAGQGTQFPLLQILTDLQRVLNVSPSSVSVLAEPGMNSSLDFVINFKHAQIPVHATYSQSPLAEVFSQMTSPYALLTKAPMLADIIEWLKDPEYSDNLPSGLITEGDLREAGLDLYRVETLEDANQRHVAGKSEGVLSAAVLDKDAAWKWFKPGSLPNAR